MYCLNILVHSKSFRVDSVGTIVFLTCRLWVNRRSSFCCVTCDCLTTSRFLYDVILRHSAYAEGTLRLEGSGVDYEGRLQIYHRGVWGTVCSHGFDSQDARVACHSLGFGSGNN